MTREQRRAIGFLAVAYAVVAVVIIAFTDVLDAEQAVVFVGLLTFAWVFVFGSVFIVTRQNRRFPRR